MRPFSNAMDAGRTPVAVTALRDFMKRAKALYTAFFFQIAS
jgi:hypothetical protein